VSGIKCRGIKCRGIKCRDTEQHVPPFLFFSAKSAFIVVLAILEILIDLIKIMSMRRKMEVWR
jgi:hypothetical protein